MRLLFFLVGFLLDAFLLREPPGLGGARVVEGPPGVEGARVVGGEAGGGEAGGGGEIGRAHV